MKLELKKWFAWAWHFLAIVGAIKFLEFCFYLLGG